MSEVTNKIKGQGTGASALQDGTLLRWKVERQAEMKGTETGSKRRYNEKSDCCKNQALTFISNKTRRVCKKAYKHHACL